MIAPLFDRIHDELRRVWRYRWLGAGVGFAVLAAAVGYALLAPSVYEAWGQIYVNKQTPLAAAAESVSLNGENLGSPYVIQKTLLNDESLQAVVRGLSPGRQLTESELTDAAAHLRRKIRISDGGDGFVEIHYTDRDPDRAEAVVRLLLDQFIGGNVRRAQRDLGQAGAFLDEQIASYGAMVAQSQARVAEFRRSHIPSGSRMELVPGPVETPIAGPAAPPSAAAARVAQLEGRLAGLLTTYTDAYPDVVATRREIEDAKAELAAEPQVAAPAPTVRRGAPVWRVREPAPLAPDVAAQWGELQRRDELLRANYEQLLSKRAATRMSQAVYGQDRAGKYQVTRTPVMPRTPIGPDRKLYLGAGAVLALVLGFGSAYLRAATRGILVSSREIEELIQLPVIAAVSYEPAWRTRSHFARAFTAPPRPRPERQVQLLLNLHMESAR